VLSGNIRSVNHPTVGRIADGGIVEREAAVDLSRFRIVSLLLLNSDFTAARDVADVINKEFGKTIATALDSNRIDVNVADSGEASVPILISRVQNLSINFRSPAKVVVNERTGTIVMGGDVRLSPVSVIHGSLTIDVQTARRRFPAASILRRRDQDGYRNQAVGERCAGTIDPAARGGERG
jgi:flagellar P-ring protein precursor FlgI